MTAAPVWDYVVVGSGSAGGVAASRLSEDPAVSVLLLEAGIDFPDEHASPPAFVTGGNVFGEGFAGSGAPVPDLDWGYVNEPTATGRVIPLLRGKLVGGSSMINAAIAVRPRPEDFERWQAAGAAGWTWEDVRPHLERVEQMIPIKRYDPTRWLPFQHVFVEAFAQLGFREIADMNAPDAWDDVVGPWPQNRRNEIRQGTLVTYLRAARARPNLRIDDRCVVDRILLDTRGRAQGVAVRPAGRAEEVVRARRVVLSAGVYGSPAILMRSGVGPGDALAAAGIETRVELPVGRGLMDHAQALFNLSAPVAVAAMGGPGIAVVARSRDWWCFPNSLDEERGVCAIAFGLTCENPIGSLTVTSRDPLSPPRIDHRFDAAIADDRFASAWRTFAALVDTPAFRRHGVRSAEREPLEEILAARIGSAFHPAGGCAIGRVVDPDLSVRGLENVSVADASVFPHHVTNNPNLTCMMIGERVVDFCRRPS